jgi:hypothetical protein
MRRVSGRWDGHVIVAGSSLLEFRLQAADAG